MSGLEVLGGVFATVSIALQLADAARKLHDFWTSVQHSPKEMKDLLLDLKLLQRVLQDIHSEEAALPVPHEALPTHEPLKKCGTYLAEIEVLARKLQVDIGKGKVKRTWQSVKVVFHNEDISRFKQNLESMKVTLILARQSLASMLSAHRDSIFSSSLVSISTQQLEAKKAMQAMESKLEQDAHIVVKTLKEQSNNAFPALAISAMESMLKSHIKESFRESCQELESKMAEHQESLASNKESIHEESSEQFWDSFPTTPKEEMSSSKPDFPPFQSDPSPIRDEAPSRHQRSVTTSTRISCHKSYTTLFGRIDINVSAIGRTVSRFGTERTDTEQIFNATFTFRPSPWISHPVVWQIAVRKDTSSTGSRLNIVPTYRPIVSHKSPILQACQYGDEQKVQDLLGSCQASISDVDEWGRGLMHMAAKSRNTDLMRTLVEQGCVKGEVDNFGNSPLDMITFFEKPCGKNDSAMVAPGHETIDIVRLLVEHGDCDPNFEHFANRCNNNLLQNLCKYRRVLDLHELTPIIHYLLTQESFSMEPSPSALSQVRDFNPMSDMLYHEEREANNAMTDLVVKHKVDATFIGDFGYSVMQDALMQNHNIAVIRSLIFSGAWLHTINRERQTPTRIAWWASKYGYSGLPFASYKDSKSPPETSFEIFDYLLEEGNFSTALRQCGVDLWEFANYEAGVLASDDLDEPLQYLTCACYHQESSDLPKGPNLSSGASIIRRKPHPAEDP